MPSRSPDGDDPRIRSRRNPLVRSLRDLAEDPRVRDRDGAFLADGVRLLEEALRRQASVDLALVSPRLERTQRGRTLRGRLTAQARRLEIATDDVVAAVIGSAGHQGAVARVAAPAYRLDDLLPARAGVVLACGLQDPGNLGGLLRAAAAAGAAGVVADADCADAWSPKAVRASAGAVFHLPLVRRAEALEVLERCRAAGRIARAAVPQEGTPYTDLDWRVPFVLVLGSEGAGLDGEILQGVDERVSIPMAHSMESLNVLSAGTLLLFEAARPRR